MGVAVVTAIREFGRIGADEYLAQPVAAILLGRADPDVDAVRPLPNMTERILDTPIARNHDRASGRSVLIDDGVCYLARAVSEFVGMAARHERIIAVESAPIGHVRYTCSEAALCIAVAVLFRIERRLRVERGIFDDEEPIQLFLDVVGHAVPFRRTGLALAGVIAEIGAGGRCCRASEERAIGSVIRRIVVAASVVGIHIHDRAEGRRAALYGSLIRRNVSIPWDETIAGERVLADAYPPLRAVSLEFAVVHGKFDHDLTPRAVARLSRPICRIEIFHDLAVVVEQAAFHPVVDRQALVQGEIADTGAGRRGYSGVELDAVAAFLLHVRQERCERGLFALAVLQYLANEVERVGSRYIGQVAQSLAILKSLDNLFEDCFLFCCHSYLSFKNLKTVFPFDAMNITDDAVFSRIFFCLRDVAHWRSRRDREMKTETIIPFRRKSQLPNRGREC